MPSQARKMRVALAIASYDGDPSANALALQASATDLRDCFSQVAIIDSGDPSRCLALAQSLAEVDAPVEYRRHEGNLGSAGNLVARLRWGDEVGADALMAVNADGVLDDANVRVMIELLRGTQSGAVYPTHVIDGGRVDLSCLRPVPVLPSRAPLARLAGREALEVRWGSSNGALYRLSAIRGLDLDAIAALWYGWEDLSVGVGLERLGHRQLMSVTAQQPTRADQKHLARTHLVVSSKAPWTTYYGVRNLMLIARRFPASSLRVVLRIIREFVMILLRDHRSKRYRYATRGLLDGIRGVTGQRVRPIS